MLSFISSRILYELMADISTSPYIGLMIDESTDVNMKKYLTINIKYLHNYSVKEAFCGLLPLESADANSIFCFAGLPS